MWNSKALNSYVIYTLKILYQSDGIIETIYLTVYRHIKLKLKHDVVDWFKFQIRDGIG